MCFEHRKLNMIKLKRIPSEAASSSSKCPQCGYDEFRRTTFRSNDPFLVRTFYKAYRCKKCRHRFFLINTIIVTWSLIIVGLSLFMLIAWTLQQLAVPELEASTHASKYIG